MKLIRSLVLLLPLLLMGCVAFERDAPDCPRFAIVSGVDEVTLFKPGLTRSESDITSRAAILSAEGVCRRDGDGVRVESKLTLLAEKGTAFAGGEQTYRYFVALLDPAGSLIAKRRFETVLPFEPEETSTISVEDIEQIIPAKNDVSSCTVLFGFDLDPDQLEYNRKRRDPYRDLDFPL
ncbi:MAG: hypothetical protein U9N14_07855 [Pseudomonadota bacterium]|nr:hypothetical protein [Pseudomonadota bacterium]